MKLGLFDLTLLLLLALLVSCGGQSKVDNPSAAESKPDLESVRHFVQDFYDWYTPVASNPQGGRASDVAIQKRASAFDSSLISQLKEDSEAQEKVHDDIVGLDFDPFLASQDPCQHYEVVDVRSEGQSYRVDVRGDGGCEKHTKPDVTAEVASKDGALVFVNFHYALSTDRDLLTILKKLRDDRR